MVVIYFHCFQEKGGEETLKDRKYLDFLDILLTARDENGKGLTPTEIRHEVDTFMFAGMLKRTLLKQRKKKKDFHHVRKPIR